MSLAEILANQDGGPRRETPCKTGVWLAKQSEKDRKAFWAWIDAKNNRQVLLEACQSEGLDATSSSLYRHVNGRCHCPRGDRPARKMAD